MRNLKFNDLEDDSEDEYYNEDPDELPAKPVFSCKDRHHNYDGYLHTHYSMDNVVYHFGL